MPLKFVSGNDNVFQILGDVIPRPLTGAPPLDPAGGPHRLCSSEISLKIPCLGEVRDKTRGSRRRQINGDVTGLSPTCLLFIYQCCACADRLFCTSPCSTVAEMDYLQYSCLNYARSGIRRVEAVIQLQL